MSLMNLLNPIKLWWAKVKTYVYIVIVGLVIALGATTAHLYKKNKELNHWVGIEINNRKQYESLLNGSATDNRVLQLTVSDLRHSNDSLVQVVDSVRKSLKIKDNALKQVQSVETVITEVIRDTIPMRDAKAMNFTIKLTPNPLTTFTISRIDSLIECIPEIYNRQDLFKYEDKVWRNPDKKFFQRLFTFDWKKDKIQRFTIVNTNPLIRVTETRIIDLNDK